MRSYIGIGKQTVDGPVVAPTYTYPCLMTGQESCYLCGFIAQRENLHMVGFDTEGESVYICPRPHVPETF
jgi:hypothetical protein